VSDEHTHDWLNERELEDDRPSASELAEYSGTIPPYDLPPEDEDPEEVDLAEARAAAERVAIRESKEYRFREALQQLAFPNWSARPTGRDAVEMAEYAKRKLDEIDG